MPSERPRTPVPSRPSRARRRGGTRGGTSTCSSAVEGRDIGSVAREIEAALSDLKTPDGYFVRMRGEVSSMRESFGSLGFGFVLAVALVYLVMVVQFRSFLDPLIVMFAVPLGIVGVLWMLFLTGTNWNIQSLMGVILMVGVVVAFSLLMVDFANRRRDEGKDAESAILEAARIRLRPILMTSLAASLGLVPMAIAGSDASGGSHPVRDVETGRDSPWPRGSEVVMKRSLMLASVAALLAARASELQDRLRPESLNLEEALAIAHHPLLERTAHEARAAEQTVREARSSYFPQIYVQGIAKDGLSGATGAWDWWVFPPRPSSTSSRRPSTWASPRSTSAALRAR